MMYRKILLPLLLGIALLVVMSSGAGATADKLGPVNENVEIFATSWCPYCKKLERFLKANDVDYTRYDIERDPIGAELQKDLGGGGVPVIRIGRTVIHGFDEEELSEVLSKLGRKSAVKKSGVTKT